MWRRAAATAVSFALWTGAQGCGSDVDLGGSIDGGIGSQAHAIAFDCDPCADDDDCAKTEVCAKLGNSFYCAATCTDTCSDSETCQAVTTLQGKSVSACAPPDGGCFRDFTPSPTDPNVCGPFLGPSKEADCHSCARGHDDCQDNGCYDGYWCDTADDECEKAPATCS